MQNILELRVRKTIQQFGMLSGGEHVLVAVSGGPDSVALLLCLHNLAPTLNLTLTVAHLNHGIRGLEAAADEGFVSRLSSGLNLPYISECMNIKEIAASEKRNLEELAREKRYEFLRRTARRIRAEKIAVGHTMNDQAETALFRFIRGSGIEGLSAIHPVVDGIVIRPLLECSRDTIREYLTAQNAMYREDSTNLDTRYSRNRLRQHVIPLLEDSFNPQLIQTLSREALLARETWSFIESHARGLFAEIHTREGDTLSLRVSDLRKIHPAMQKEVLRVALREYLGSLRNISSTNILNILSLLNEQSGAQIQLPHGGVALRQFDEIRFSRSPLQRASDFFYELRVPGRCSVPEFHAEFMVEFCIRPEAPCTQANVSTQAFFDQAVLSETLTIRPRKPGDRYGGPGHRKVKKMLIDNKIPVSARSTLPMVVDGHTIVWIPGFRPVRGFEAKPNATNCICIRMQKSE